MPYSTQVTTPTFIANIVSININYFSLGIYTFGSLVSPESSILGPGSIWILFFSRVLTCLINQGTAVLELNFIVTSETSNFAQVMRFAILRSSIFTCLPHFLVTLKIIHDHIEDRQLILRVYLITFSRTPQTLVLERLEFSF